MWNSSRRAALTCCAGYSIGCAAESRECAKTSSCCISTRARALMGIMTDSALSSTCISSQLLVIISPKRALLGRMTLQQNNHFCSRLHSTPGSTSDAASTSQTYCTKWMHHRVSVDTAAWRPFDVDARDWSSRG